MISDLPTDIVEEILLRVPLKSMKAVRLTCKRWNTVSKNRNFVTKKGESLMIMIRNNNLHLMRVINNGDPYIVSRGTLTCLTEQATVSQVFHCEGLLLCIFQVDSGINTKLMVWSPHCSQPKWFEPKVSCSRYYQDLCFYGLGYVEKKQNNSCVRSHKVVRFIHQNNFPNHVNGGFFSWCQIYDFESDSWTTLDITPLQYIKFYGLGVTIKGNTYWCVTERNGEKNFHIICFDFTKETFRTFMHLPFNAGIHEEHVTLSCVREEKLAALLQHRGPNPQELEIWITTTIEPDTVTWSKFLTVDMGPEIRCTLESFIVDEDKKLIISYGDKITIIGEFGYFRELDVFGESVDKYQRRYLCGYVPSFVQIKQCGGGKRKRQDIAENSDNVFEKMLRLAGL